MIVTLTIPLAHTTLASLIIYVAPNMMIGWIESRPILMCTIMDANTYNIFLYSVMTQIILFKIILIVSPSRFLGINTSKTEFFCLGLIGLCVVYLIGHVIIYGHRCNGLAFLVIIKEHYKLDVSIPNLKEIEGLRATLNLGLVLFVVFIIELGLQLYIAVKKAKLKKKLKKQRGLILTISGQNTIELNGQNASQQNSKTTSQPTSQNTNQDSSYNYTLILVTKFILQMFVFIMIIKTKDVFFKTILSYLLNILSQFGMHIVPVLWILNHEPIKMYVLHKLYQIKVKFIV